MASQLKCEGWEETICANSPGEGFLKEKPLKDLKQNAFLSSGKEKMLVWTGSSSDDKNCRDLVRDRIGDAGGGGGDRGRIKRIPP